MNTHTHTHKEHDTSGDVSKAMHVSHSFRGFRTSPNLSCLRTWATWDILVDGGIFLLPGGEKTTTGPVNGQNPASVGMVKYRPTQEFSTVIVGNVIQTKM